MWHAGHYYRALTLGSHALVGMAMRPIIEAGGGKVHGRVKGAQIMAQRAGEAGVEQADNGRALDRWLVVQQQAFGRMCAHEADAVDGNFQAASSLH